jgi:hypothetical protein
MHITGVPACAGTTMLKLIREEKMPFGTRRNGTPMKQVMNQL